MKRSVQPELLDILPPGDLRAIRSRHDLRRVNWWMRNHSTMASVLRKFFPDHAPKHITEIGAGDGDFLLSLARRLAPSWTKVKATLLDRQLNVSITTLGALAVAGWQIEVVTADVFDWKPKNHTDQVIIANLFLHHFENAKLTELLQKISRQTNLFVAIEPRRFAFPSLGGGLLALIGCNDVTQHDGTASIQAGFNGQEISKLWPDKENWRLTEARAGLFSHLFIAERLK